jgi:L-histidine Nalpha-methyltransferase
MSVTAGIEVLFSPEERNTELREELRVGLSSMPKELQPKWFYDERGSELFDLITQLPEYHLTRAERSILERHAAEIALLTDPATLIELASGTIATGTRAAA